MEIYLIILGALVLLSILYYNQLIRLKKEVSNSEGSINAMLKNRYDLIPNLVETTKTYMVYEAEILSKLTKMRSEALNTQISDSEKQNLDNEIHKALHQLKVSVENYPELKANSNFLILQEKWADIEDKLSASRRFYNNSVTEYNVAIASFPKNIIAKSMGYKPLRIFEVTTEESQNVHARELFTPSQK